jgi:hypothetical protein
LIEENVNFDSQSGYLYLLYVMIHLVLQLKEGALLFVGKEYKV